MIGVSELSREKLEKLIVEQIPRDLVMALEDAYRSGDERGRMSASEFAAGHRPSAAGSGKHFHINEAFHEALQAHGAEPTPLRGTQIVVGRVGIFHIARLNVPGHKWVSLRRSAMRERLAEFNRSIQHHYVQRSLLDEDMPPPVGGTIFVLGVMDGQDANGVAQLTQVMITLPAPDMKSWLYKKSVAELLDVYDRPETVVQADNVKPRLKPQPKIQTGNDHRN
jgi:hypothetical protein